MKHVIISAILLSPLLLAGQANPNWYFTSEPTFQQMKTRATTYFDSILLANGTLTGTGYQYYKRWEWFWESRLGQTGKFSQARNAAINTFASSAQNEKIAAPPTCTDGNSWTEVGPNTFPGTTNYQRGIGQMTFFRFHPGYNGGTEQTIYTGGASGLWKSINDGVSWSLVNTDKNEITSCADLAINYQSPTTLYLATGAEKSNSLFSPFGTAYEESYGVLKSTNSGTTWTTIGPNYNNYSDMQFTDVKVGRLRIHPTNPNILYLVVYFHSWSNGSHWEGKIFKTIDAGGTWNVIYNSTNTHLLDMEFKPDNANVFYVSGYRILRFTDTQTNTGLLTPLDMTAALGTSWKANASGGIPAGSGHAIRLEMEVTPIAPDNLYVIGCQVGANPSYSDGFENLWISSNAGSAAPTFTIKNPTGVTGGGYNASLQISRQMCCLAVSPVNANEIYMGGIALGRSTDGGTSFSKLNTGNKIHPDNREIECAQTTSGTLRLFTCNDAGIYMTNDNGTTWSSRSAGLGVARLYSVDISYTPNASSSDKIIVGLQDCTSMIKDQTGWFQPNVFGDGMVVAIDPTNDNIMYQESQFGSISRSTNGLSFSGIVSSGAGEWVTPYLIDPNNHNKLIVGKTNLDIVDFTSSSSGVLTTKTNPIRPTVFSGSMIVALAVAPSNSNHIITSYEYGNPTGSNNQVTNALFRTTDGGNTWTDITPTSFSHINSPVKAILFHPTDPLKIWIALGGYDWAPTHKKVLKSTNGGATWTDYMNGVPNMPCNALAINTNRLYDEEIYVATDVGVYFRNRFMSSWQCFNGLLPNVAITDLKSNQNKKMLFASAFGRGVWKTPFFCPSVPSYTLTTSPLDFYAASSFITSTSVIGSNRTVAYRAPTINLNAGFQVAVNTEFTARAYSCTAFTPDLAEPIAEEPTPEENAEDRKRAEQENHVLELAVFPVPAKEEIAVTYALKTPSNVSIVITDISGRPVRYLHREAKQAAGEYRHAFNVGEITNGMYYLVLQTQQGYTTKKIVLQK